MTTKILIKKTRDAEKFQSEKRILKITLFLYVHHISNEIKI